MSTRVELEDQAHYALMDVNRHWLEALSAEQSGDLIGSHSAFDDMVTAARAGRAAVEALESLVVERGLGESRHMSSGHGHAGTPQRKTALAE